MRLDVAGPKEPAVGTGSQRLALAVASKSDGLKTLLDGSDCLTLPSRTSCSVRLPSRSVTTVSVFRRRPIAPSRSLPMFIDSVCIARAPQELAPPRARFSTSAAGSDPLSPTHCRQEALEN
eukprot:6934852-Prymnesium_polylepis.3